MVLPVRVLEAAAAAMGSLPADSRTGGALLRSGPPAPLTRFHSLPVGRMLVNSSVPSGRTRFQTAAPARDGRAEHGQRAQERDRIGASRQSADRNTYQVCRPQPWTWILE